MQVSIVVNTYNRAGSLADLLSSLPYQTHDEFELIVVTGPCTDDTPELLREWEGRIRVVECPETHLSISRNLGIDAAAGEIVAFVDDDAVPSARWLEELVAAYDDDSVAGAGGIVYDDAGFTKQYEYAVCDRSAETRFDVRPPLDRYVHPGADPFLYLQGTNCSFRRDRLAEIGGFDEEIEYFLDDVDVCLELIDRGHRLRALPGAAVQHRYLRSHIRDHRGVVQDPYPAVKNRLRFALRHGLARHSANEILERHLVYLESLRAVARNELDAGRIDVARSDWFLGRLEDATRAGIELGTNGERRGREIAPRDPAAFRRFPVLRPEGGALRICFTSTEYPPEVGGIGRWTADLARELAGEGHEVHVVTAAAGRPEIRFENGCWVHRLGYADLAIPELEGSPLAGLLYRLSIVQHEVDRLRREAPIGIVSGGLWNSEGHLAALDRSTPAILTLHTSYEKIASMHPSWRELPHTHQTVALEHRTLARARFVLANSEASLNDARDLLDPAALDATWVVPHGVRDRRGEVERRRADDGRVRLLFVGRLERRKGVDVLLEVAPELLREFPQLEIVLVGRDTDNTEIGSSYREAFERRYGAEAGVADRVVFAGEVGDEELTQAYADADLFCAPSRSESFGLTVVEAMSFGLPVVACRAGGMAGLIVDGESGLVVEPGDPAALAEALGRMAGDAELRSRLAAAARQRFEEHYDLPVAVSRMVEVYRDVIRRAPPGPPDRGGAVAALAADLESAAWLDRGAARRAAARLLDGPAAGAGTAALDGPEPAPVAAGGRLGALRSRPLIGRILRYLKRLVLAPWNIQRTWDSVQGLVEESQSQRRQLTEHATVVGDRVGRLEQITDVIARKLELLALDVRELGGAESEVDDSFEPRIPDRAAYEVKLASMNGGLRVNLGSGEKPLEGYINVDRREAEGAELVADIRDLPFEPGTISELASHHLVEHFREHQLATRILPYWRSLLRPGGTIRIVCPNWEVMLERVGDGTMPYSDFKTVTFGAQDYAGDDHFAMYTPRSLGRLLAAAGFTDVEVVVADRQNGMCPEMELVARAPGSDH